MAVQFTKATKRKAKARIAITGPAGSGKTYTALRVASAMCTKLAVIDTEHGSASKYASDFTFDVLELNEFHPNNYVEAIKAAADAGYDGLVIDSASHEWSGKGGCLELVDMYAKRRSGNTYAAWADVTPLHTGFIEAIHSAPMHVFANFRSKMDYLQSEDPKTGKKVIQKVGMAPITRDGAEYEFDIVGDLDLEHNMVITKSRCKALADKMIPFPGEQFAKAVSEWLTDGASVEAANTSAPTEAKSDSAKTAPPAVTPPTQTSARDSTNTTPPAVDHPNKNKITTALCGAIHTAATRMSMNGTDLHALAGRALGKDTVATLYELGPSRDPYAKLLNDINVLWTEQQKKASGN